MIETRNDVDQLTEAAVARARTILTEADKVRDRRGSANQRRFARLLQDPAAVGVTMSLTDEVMRISEPTRAARALRRAARKASPRGLGTRDALGVRFIAAVSPMTRGSTSCGTIVHVSALASEP